MLPSSHDTFPDQTFPAGTFSGRHFPVGHFTAGHFSAWCFTAGHFSTWCFVQSALQFKIAIYTGEPERAEMLQSGNFREFYKKYYVCMYVFLTFLVHDKGKTMNNT